MYTPAIKFENDILRIIDQTILPKRLQYISLKSLEDSIDAIKNLKVRGAPAIGIVSAYTMYLQAKKLAKESLNDFIRDMDQTAKLLPRHWMSSRHPRPSSAQRMWKRSGTA